MRIRLFSSPFSFSLFVLVSFSVLTGCIFSPEYGPISTGIYVTDSPLLLACHTEIPSQYDSLVTKTYWNVGTKRIISKTYVGGKLVCRGGARLGDLHGDTLMVFNYQDSCMTRESGIFNPAIWTRFKADSIPLLLDQKNARGFRLSKSLDSSWVDFRKLR